MVNFVRDKNALKQGMSIDQVYNFLTSLGVHGNWVDEHKLIFETACHNHKGEGSHKLYYYDNTRLFSCYTGCGRFDIFELLSKMHIIETNEELSLDEAISMYVDSQAFLTIGSEEKENLPIFMLDEEYVKPELRHYDKKDFIELPRIIVNDWIEEGISERTQHKYNIRFNWAEGSIAFPHLDSNLNLIGIRQRMLNPESIIQKGKYRPLDRKGILYSSPLSFYLFGLEYNSLNIRKMKKAIVQEGEKSCLKGDTMLGPDQNIVVSSFGMHFSRHQYEALKSLGVEEIIIGFDRQFKELGDQEYLRLVDTYRKIEERFGRNEDGIKFTYILDTEMETQYKDAPIDQGIATFQKLYNERKTMAEIEEKYSFRDLAWEALSDAEYEGSYLF